MSQSKSLRWKILLFVLLSTVPGAFAAGPQSLSSSDWAGIRAAYDAHQHEVAPVAEGYTARNPGQDWRVDFDGRGFLARPKDGAWQWGLELESYGSAGQLGPARGMAARAEGSRVTYERANGLWEWVSNDQRGLEHGLTVAQPAVEPDEMEFRFAVRGNLYPQLSGDGQVLHFVDAEKETIVNYSALAAWDAEGRALPSHFVVADDKVGLKVEIKGARYPITIDPLAQQAYLKASNTDTNDLFGTAVAISGDTVVIGARGEASIANGVNGNQTDNSAVDAGAAYVFVRSGSTWMQQAYLKASNTGAGDNFGLSVAIAEDSIVVGAPMEDSNAIGINGNQADNSATDAGAAYLFVRNGTTWSQQAYLKASNAEALDGFGQSVAISGDSVIVGAFGESSTATGVNGDQTNNGAFTSGAAYVFVRSGTTWTQQAYLKASNTEANDTFGISVAVSGDSAVVGAFSEDSNATGVNGTQADNSAQSSGAAYVFVRNGVTWSQQAYLKASNTGASDLFGNSVDIDGDTVVVGAPFEDSNATGINGDGAPDSVLDSGAAYVFVRNGTTWSQQVYVKASNTGADDFFGNGVAISGDSMVIGAPFEDSNATGINGDETQNSALDSGAAYLFVRSGTSWSQQAYLKASNAEAGDNFGNAIAISGSGLIVGALAEDSNATGSNDDQTQNGAVDSGAAYVFTSLGTTLGNISTRLRVETGDNVLIGGFIITGSASKKVILLAIGPSLPLSGKLADPTLELYDGAGTLLATNDNWMDSTNSQAIIDSGLPPTNDLESAILTTLDPGLYTAIMRGANSGTGIGLVEAYDLDNTVDSELANISTRGLVQTGDNVMIGGFILQGMEARDVLVRAIGPSLPLAGKLADPTMDLFDGNGTLVATNDNWRDTQEAVIAATMLAPTDDAESAIFATLNPGAYTAIVRGQDSTTGIALFEGYALTPAP